MKKMLVYSIVGIILVSSYLYFASLFDKMIKADYEFFYSNKVNGILVYSSGSSSGEIFQLEKLKYRYRFRSIMNGMNDDKPFSTIAKKGDSVFKSSFSDTLFLIKRDNLKIYRYTFQKF